MYTNKSITQEIAMLLLYLSLIDDTSDKAKFKTIYMEYRQLMWSEANKILHDPIEAEDIVHIAFMEILKNLQTIHDPICPQTRNFVMIISRSRAINLYKKRKREKEISFETIADYNLENHILSESLADEAELKEKVMLLNKLPTHYRDILYLRTISVIVWKKLPHCWEFPKITLKNVLHGQKNSLHS